MAGDEADEPNVAGARFVLGLGLALLNMALSSVGLTMQRYAKLLSDKEKREDTQSLCQSEGEVGSPTGSPTSAALLQLPACGLELRGHHVFWGIGVLLYIVAAVPDVFAYMLVPQVVCTTVACFRLVFVTFLGHFVLQEHVKRLQCLGISICTMGTSLVMWFGPRTDEAALHTAQNEFYHSEVYTYLVAGLTLLVVLLVVEHSSDSGCCQAPQQLWFALPVATGLAYALEKVFNTEIGFTQAPDGWQGLLEHPRYALMWLAMALLGVTDFYLNVRGPRRLPMQVFLPIAFAFGSSLQFFQSVFIFREFQKMKTTHAALSIVGAVVSLVGALLVGEPAPDDDAFEDGNDLFDDLEEPTSTNNSRLGRTPEGSEEDEPL